MRRASIIVFVLMVMQSLSWAQSVKIMSFNIRLDTPVDSADQWQYRREYVISMIRFHQADVIGLQEVQKHQLDYIMQSLPGFGYIGVGRDDGKSAGEFSALLYRKSRLDTLMGETFWCSETPDKPGKGWDAACPRVVTYGKFRDKINNRVFYVYNTHLDHIGEVARLESAKLIKRHIGKIDDNLPVIVTGDFNSSPDSPPYQYMVKLNDKPLLHDSRNIAQEKHHGPDGTFTGFAITAVPNQPIDYIFVSNGVKVLRHATLSDTFNGRLPSDHYPVFAEIVINGE